MKIILSRTDNLGDVILTLPVAGFLKEQDPTNEVYFIGKSYTRPIIEACQFVDKFLDKDDILKDPQKLASLQADAIIFIFPDQDLAPIAKKAKIPLRVGTSHRWWHWLYCNKRIDFSRKESPLHEAQLNFKLLEGLGFNIEPNFGLIADWFGLKTPDLIPELQDLLSKEKLNVILHPKSKGSAREWHLDSYFALAQNNPDIQFFVTGTQAEGDLIQSQKPDLLALENVYNLAGKFSLSELLMFISICDGLVACSTGPLHIASALGIHALGIYPPIKPMHPTRWQPIGKKAKVLVLDKDCSDCRKTENCSCINAISVAEVSAEIKDWQRQKNEGL
ncbi:MAG: glycosyltransferase family 9 protein [Raineya sp.]|jgi:ADP-heptose:LPS heptosyltransferase|nr:glycosyltransferase family 9 protein [Raineya sp.]